MAEREERPIGGVDDEDDEYPIGFRFKPSTEELVEFYLLPKLLDEPTVPNEFVIEADAYECDPEILTERYKERGVDDTWYFLSPRYRKYPGGKRPVRGTADRCGRWKPSTGQSKPKEEEDAFSENTLAYYVGSAKAEGETETKTKWLMHELVVPDNGLRGGKSAAAPHDDMLLNRYVMCKIYKSPLRKWKEIEEAAAAAEVPTSSQSSGSGSGSAAAAELPTSSQSSGSAAAAEVPTSSQSSGSAPECVGQAAAAQAPSSSRSSRQPPAKRAAVERPPAAAASAHQTGDAPNKRVPRTTPSPGGRLAPTRASGGAGSSLRMPPVGAGAGAAGCHGGPGLPPLVHWPPRWYNSMQGPVQIVQQQQQQRPPLMNGYRYSNPAAAGMPSTNAQAPWQGAPPPVLRLRPPHRAAAATSPNSQGATMTMMGPPNPPAGQPARLPSPQHQQQQPPPPLRPETEEECRNRVYARLIAEMRLQNAKQDSAGQQGIGQTAAAQPAACSRDRDEGANNHPAGVEATVVVPPAQRPQRQQSSYAAPAPAVEKAPAAEKVPSMQSVPPGADEGSGKGDAAAMADDILLQILSF